MNVALGRAARLAALSLIAGIGQSLGAEGCIPIKQYEPVAAGEGGMPAEGGAPGGGEAGAVVGGASAEGGLGGEPGTSGTAGTPGTGGAGGARGGSDSGGAGAGGGSSDCPANQYRDESGACLDCPTSPDTTIQCLNSVATFDATALSITFDFNHTFYGARDGTTMLAFPEAGESFPYAPDGDRFTVMGVPATFENFRILSFMQVDECGIMHTMIDGFFITTDTDRVDWACTLPVE